jgi:hypothetical protein
LSAFIHVIDEIQNIFGYKQTSVLDTASLSLEELVGIVKGTTVTPSHPILGDTW